MLFAPQSLQWLELILEERFGHRFVLTQTSQVLSLAFPGLSGTILFDTLEPVFHESRSDFPCGEWDGAAEGWGTVFGTPIPAPGEVRLPIELIEPTEHGYTLHYDILGLTYWMLSRLEEVGRTDLDEHGRFPATSSHAFKHGYLEFPIVDEWLHILGQVIQRQWAGLKLKQHQFSMKVSHDVDDPSRYGFCDVKSLVRRMAGDVLKRRDFKNAAMAPWIRINSKTRLHPADPVNTFDWIMDQSDQHGLTSAFYFICGRTDPRKDADYEPEHSAIRELMRRIHKRGHEIGLHPSFNSYQNPQAIVTEANCLRTIMREEGIEQGALGGRMHYLRWEHPTTLRSWELAGMNYDSTLSYADRPGFRCGTCHEYPAFDPVAQQQLKLRIRPLVTMECTVTAERYMGLGTGEAAYTKFSQLKDRCRAVGGYYTLLWHNSQFESSAEATLYQELLVGC